jgi:hypothetical protein
VDRLPDLLVEVAKMVVADVVYRSSLEAAQATHAVDHTFDDQLFHSQNLLREHLAQLKPALGNKGKQALLDLEQAEVDRFSTSLRDINAYRQQRLAAEYDASVRFIHRLVHATTTLVKLFDSCLYVTDLSEDPFVPVGDRKTLATLVRQYRRNEKEAKEGAPLEPGTRFVRNAWVGVPLDNMLLSSKDLGREDEAPEPESPPKSARGGKKPAAGGKSARSKKGGKDEEPEEEEYDLTKNSRKVTGYRIQPNRVLMAVRDHSFGEYAKLFQTRTSGSVTRAEEVTSVENAKQANWQRKMKYIKEVMVVAMEEEETV